MLNSWLHVIALTVYLGTVVALWLMLLPAASAVDDQGTRTQFLIRALKLYNPVQIGALGVVLFTGVTAAQAYALCSFKVDFRVGEAVNQVKMVYGAIPKGLLARGKS